MGDALIIIIFRLLREYIYFFYFGCLQAFFFKWPDTVFSLQIHRQLVCILI